MFCFSYSFIQWVLCQLADPECYCCLQMFLLQAWFFLLSSLDVIHYLQPLHSSSLFSSTVPSRKIVNIIPLPLKICSIQFSVLFWLYLKVICFLYSYHSFTQTHSINPFYTLQSYISKSSILSLSPCFTSI